MQVHASQEPDVDSAVQVDVARVRTYHEAGAECAAVDSLATAVHNRYSLEVPSNSDRKKQRTEAASANMPEDVGDPMLQQVLQCWRMSRHASPDVSRGAPA